LNAESTITRAPGETLIVEPDGAQWHLSPNVRIERGSGSYKYIVILRDTAMPSYLRAAAPDIDVR
jgi:hypothetical protein